MTTSRSRLMGLRQGSLPDRLYHGLPQPFTPSDILYFIGLSVSDGILRTARFALFPSLLCAVIYHKPLWGFADGFGWVGLCYFIYFWFEVGNMKPVETKRDQHTFWLCPEIDADDVRWLRAGSALTASAICFYLNALAYQVLNFLGFGWV